MKLEAINNKQVMNIGLVNINYNKEMQKECLVPYVDIFIYYDYSDMNKILDYIRDNDIVYITSYAFLHDISEEARFFKKKLDEKSVIFHGIQELTMDNGPALNNFTFSVLSAFYEAMQFVSANRITPWGEATKKRKFTLPDIDESITLDTMEYIVNNNKTISIKQLKSVPNKSGLYYFYGTNDELLYIGKAKNLRSRITTHINGASNLCRYSKNIKRIEYSLIESALERELYETYAINTLMPILNLSKTYEFHNLDLDEYVDKEILKEEENERATKQKRIDKTLKDFFL